MNGRPTLSGEFRIIPTPMKVLAALVPVFAVAITLAFLLLARAPATQGGTPPRVGIAAVFLLVAPVVFSVLAVIWVLLVGYVWADAGRRRMSRVAWLLIVIFVPNALGFILYFVLRQPIPSQCPGCGHSLEADVTYCPKCGRQIADACPNCKHPVGLTDAFCPACGHSLKGAREGGGVPV